MAKAPAKASRAKAATPAVDADEELEDDELDPVVVDDELEDDEEPITEIPVHGVLAPEGIETGDGRGFREGAISSRRWLFPRALLAPNCAREWPS